MKIKRLLIQNFRNISYIDFKPHSQFNIIYGNNGSGKTSVLEAISYLSLSRSFVCSNYRYLIKRESGGFNLFASINENGINNVFDTSIGISRNTNSDTVININGEKSNSLIDLVNRICVQVIYPHGISLITEGPELRRNFLDWGVFYINQEFNRLWQDYKRTLKQRNALLKTYEGNDFSYIKLFDQNLENLSNKINLLREQYLVCLKEILDEILEIFLPKFNFNFSLSWGYEKDTSLASQLALNLEKDRILGYTFYGCHRADLKIKTNKLSAGSTLSRGQLKLLVCALRLAQGLLLRKMTDRSCIYLLDDLNSELDSNSQQILLSFLMKSDCQVFITNITKELQLPSNSESSFFNIEDGSFINN